MRVLIYVEPHPIRGSQTIFADIARRFLPLLRASTPDFDVRMFASEPLEKALGEKAIAGVEKRLIRATSAEEAMFRSHLNDWETGGVDDWLSLMDGGSVADPYVGVLRRVWSVFPFDIVVHWGENGAVARFVDERPITRIAMELGCTRNPFLPTVALDPFGTNGSGIVSRLNVDDLREIVGDWPMSAAEALYGYSANVEAEPYEQQFLPLDAGDESARLLAARDKVAFLPLQLHDDANLLRFSKYDTVEQVVLDVVPKLAAAGYTVVVKTHPDAKSRPLSRSAFALARESLKPWADSVVWIDANRVNFPNAQLVALADVVVTVNSSVGFEALFFDKVVCVLGEAVYKPLDLFPTLDEVAAGTFDTDAYLAGVALLRRFMLGGYLASDSVRSTFSTFESVALTIDAANRAHQGDAFSIARDTYRALSLTRQHQTRMRLMRGGSVPGTSEFGAPIPAPSVSVSPTEPATKIAITPFTGPARRLLAATGASDSGELRKVLTERLADANAAAPLLRASGILDEKFYLVNHKDVAKAGKDPVEHWLGYGHREGRKLRAGLAVASMQALIDELVDAATSLLEEGALPEYPLEPVQAERREQDLRRIAQGLGQTSNSIAVVAHLYYRNLVPELLDQLANIPEKFDLIVTVPDWGSREILDAVRGRFPQAFVYRAANRGRDIGPFIDVLPSIVDHGYDAVLHLQTKAGYFHAGKLRADLGKLWRDEALGALLGSQERVRAILEALRADDAVQQVGPQPHYLSLSRYPYHDGGELASLLLPGGAGQGFFAGTMFWARPESLRLLVGDVGLTLTNFDAESGANDGALAHLVERLFGHAAVAEGGRVVGAPVDPSVPLDLELEPLSQTIHAYMESALRERARSHPGVGRGALAW